MRTIVYVFHFDGISLAPAKAYTQGAGNILTHEYFIQIL